MTSRMIKINAAKKTLQRQRDNAKSCFAAVVIKVHGFSFCDDSVGVIG
ncbi:MAG: hypothetical protein QM533_06975 [Cytophagales bacterium]|nr:hypothetical protein [Cytophagales bacterium]